MNSSDKPCPDCFMAPVALKHQVLNNMEMNPQQLCSSFPLPQSLIPSHSLDFSMQLRFVHVNWLLEHIAERRQLTETCGSLQITYMVCNALWEYNQNNYVMLFHYLLPAVTGVA